MTNEIVTWEEAVISNQERNIALFEEKKVMITTCTSNERLNEMRAQIKGVLLTAQEMKLRSIMEDAIELLALIRWQLAELNPPQRGKRSDLTYAGVGTGRKTNAEAHEASRNRKYARQWPNKEALEADIAAMRSGDQEAERKLVVLEKHPISKKEYAEQATIGPMAEAIAYLRATGELQGAVGKMEALYQACVEHFGGINDKLMGGVTESVMEINNVHRKLESMRNKTKLVGVKK